MRGLAFMLGAAAATAALGGAAFARAEALSHGRLSLEWDAPQECPNAVAALERVRSLLASSPDASEPVQARGTIRKTEPGGWELALETAQGAQRFERSVRAGSCEEATDAGALIIALAIDPALDTRGSEPARQSPSDTPASEPEQPVAERPATEAPVRTEAASAPADRPGVAPGRSPSGTTWRLVASALGDLGTLPRFALGAQIGAALELLPLRLELVGTVLPPARETIAGDRGGDISLIAGGPRACYALGRRLSGLACAGVELGQLRGTGVAASWTDSQAVFWSAGRAGVAGRYAPAPSWALRLGVEALFPVTRPEFVLENVGPVHQPETAVGRLDLGFELAL